MFAEEKKNGERKRGKYLERENIFFLWRRRKTEKEKGGQYLEKENMFWLHWLLEHFLREPVIYVLAEFVR